MPSLFLPEVALQATSSSGKPNIKWLHSSGCQNHPHHLFFLRLHLQEILQISRIVLSRYSSHAGVDRLSVSRKPRRKHQASWRCLSKRIKQMLSPPQILVGCSGLWNHWIIILKLQGAIYRRWVRLAKVGHFLIFPLLAIIMNSKSIIAALLHYCPRCLILIVMGRTDVGFEHSWHLYDPLQVLGF